MAIEVLVPYLMKIGGGAISETSSILKRLEVKRPLIVTDAFLVRVGLEESYAGNSKQQELSVTSIRRLYRIRRPKPWLRAYALSFNASMTRS